jgi:hypothetical protein
MDCNAKQSTKSLSGHLRCRAVAAQALLWVAAGCGPEPERKPPGFEPTGVQERYGGHIARCNTVHSLTLPQSVLREYGVAADVNTAVLSCSLQVGEGVPVNVPAQILGTVTTLTGRTSELDFTEILEGNAVSYFTPFDLSAKSEMHFEVSMTDVETGGRYDVELRQVELPGRP